MKVDDVIQALMAAKKWIVAVLVLLFITLALGIPKFGIDASSDSILLEGDSSLKFFQKITKRYNAGDTLIVGYIVNAGTVFSKPAIADIAALTEKLATLEQVKSVNSITNVPLLFSPKGNIQQLISSPRTLLTADTDSVLAAQEFNSNPLYKDTLVSSDQRSTVISLNLEVDEYYLQQVAIRDQLLAVRQQGALTTEQAEQYSAIEQLISELNTLRQSEVRQFIRQIDDIVDDYRQSADIILGGATMITINMIDFVKQDMLVFGILILLIIVLTLWQLFKQWQMVMLSLLSCLSVIVMMVGLLGWLNWKVTLISSNFMIFLLIISIATCIHLLIRFRECYQQATNNDLDQAVQQMLQRMWQPCLYNMLTTVLAFSSLVVSGIRPVIDFGLIMSIGVAMALILCLLIIPIGLSFFPNLPRKQLSNQQGQRLKNLASLVQRRGLSIYASAIVVSVIAISGALKIDVENRFIDFFKEHTSVARSMTFLDTEFGGTMPFDIILNAPLAVQSTDSAEITASLSEEDDDLFEDDLFDDTEAEQQQILTSYWWSIVGLQQIEQLHDFLETQPEVGKVLSLASGYKLAKSYLDIKLTDVEIAILRQSLGDLEQDLLTSYLYEADNQTRISMRIHETSDNLNRNDLIKRIAAFANSDMQLQPGQLQFTGLMMLYNNMLQSLFESQIVTLGTVFIAIMLMVAILFRSILLAAVAIAPNMIAALLVLGVMGHLGISLDFMTITIAAITIGIGIDYAIHYIYRFRREVAAGLNCIDAVTMSHQSIGRSLVFSALTIILGFSVLCFSNFIPSILFAVLTSLAMFSALIGVLTLIPRLLMLISPIKIVR